MSLSLLPLLKKCGKTMTEVFFALSLPFGLCFYQLIKAIRRWVGLSGQHESSTADHSMASIALSLGSFPPALLAVSTAAVVHSSEVD